MPTQTSLKGDPNAADAQAAVLRTINEPSVFVELRVGAEMLKHRTLMIGDIEDLRFWQQRRSEWIRTSATAVERGFGPAAVRRFRELAYGASTP